MREIVELCVGCDFTDCLSCSLNGQTVAVTCDHCHDYFDSGDRIYYLDGKDVCEDCLFEEFKKTFKDHLIAYLDSIDSEIEKDLIDLRPEDMDLMFDNDEFHDLAELWFEWQDDYTTIDRIEEEMLSYDYDSAYDAELDRWDEDEPRY